MPFRSILTVLEQADTLDLTTLDTLKSELGITTNDQDDHLRRVIRQASSAIADYTNRVWGRERLQESFPNEVRVHRDWNDPAEFGIQLRRSPIIEIESITDGYGATLTTDSYQVDLSSGTIYRTMTDVWTGSAVRFWRLAPQTVVYTAGYVLLGALPEAVEMACLELCKVRWGSRGRDPSVRSIDIPGVKSVQYWVGPTGDNGAIPPSVSGLLDRYIVPNV